MSEQRVIIQMGQGVDLSGTDPDAAALRAVQNAMNGAALPVLSGFDPVRIAIHIGAPDPDAVDPTPLVALFPNAQAQLRKGGLSITDPDTKAKQIVVTAAIEVFVAKPGG